MTSASKPWWQQATAVVSLGASGTITGFSVTPHHPAEMGTASPAHVRLLALRQMATPAASAAEVTFRTAIVKAAEYYLRLAQHTSPADMEALIWQHDSVGGADHGQSCAAFASLTLEMASKVVGRDSWVTGGTSYPWPLHEWADVRVDSNPASPGIVSVQQDAQAHHRWHPLGDGYAPQPGDWVLFNGHVEVVTKYAGGALSTIGGDSLPNLSVNAHEYHGSLSGDGVVGFVDNDEQPATTTPTAGGGQAAAVADSGQSSADPAPGATGTAPGSSGTGQAGAGQAGSGGAAIPGLTTHTAPIPAQAHGHRRGATGATARIRTAKLHPHRSGRSQGFAQAGSDVRTEADVPGAVRFGPAAEFQQAKSQLAHSQKTPRGGASIPGAATGAAGASSKPATSHQRYQPPAETTPVQLSSAQRAFVAQIAPGAVAAQRQYGVPASVTIAQAIDESGWGQSGLATQAHNLFGMKGDGPAGSDTQLTEEYEDGHWQVTSASFRSYHTVEQSIEDHGKLLATSGYYQTAMHASHDPDAFASALTGVYATDPQYGQTLIKLMQQYNLYQYNHQDTAKTPTPATGSARPGTPSAKASTGPSANSYAGPPAKASTMPPAKPGTASIPGDSQPSGSTSLDAGGPSSTPGGASINAGGPSTSPGSASTGSSQPSPSQHVATGHGGSGSRSSGGHGGTGRGTAGHGGRPRRGGTAGRTSTSPIRIATPPSRGSTSPVSSAPGASPSSSTSAPTPTTAPSAGAPSGASPLTPAPVPPIAPPSPPASTGGTKAPRAPASARASVPSPRTPRATTPASSPSPRRSRPTGPASSPGRAAAPAMAAPAGPSRSAKSGSQDQTITATLLAKRTTAQSAGQAPPAGRRVTARDRSPARDVTTARDATPAGQVPAASAVAAGRYDLPLPRAVRSSFVALARTPLLRSESLYQDVASDFGLPWELLAACDWMQCESKPRHSPVHGERLGTVNPDGTVYHTRSQALAQCAEDLMTLAGDVYGIDLTTPACLSVRDLANVYAAFRWGALLKTHRTSAMEFPYSVAGLTVYKINMRWPGINEPHAPDKPGTRFKRPFGAVPVVLALDYPATTPPSQA